MLLPSSVRGKSNCGPYTSLSCLSGPVNPIYRAVYWAYYLTRYTAGCTGRTQSTVGRTGRTRSNVDSTWRTRSTVDRTGRTRSTVHCTELTRSTDNSTGQYTIYCYRILSFEVSQNKPAAVLYSDYRLYVLQCVLQ